MESARPTVLPIRLLGGRTVTDIEDDGGPQRSDVSDGDVPTGRLTFRTVWGGPSPQVALIEERARIGRRLRDASFSYDFDLFLTIGGEISPGTGPSGLRTPRVFLKRRRATGEILMARDDISASADPAALLRHTIHMAVSELIGRVAARDPAVDAAAERASIAFLLDEARVTDAQVRSGAKARETGSIEG